MVYAGAFICSVPSGGQRLTVSVFLYFFPPYALRKGEFTTLARAPGICLSLCPKVHLQACVHMPIFKHGVGNLNSGHACTPNTLHQVISLAPTSCIICKLLLLYYLWLFQAITKAPINSSGNCF